MEINDENIYNNINSTNLKKSINIVTIFEKLCKHCVFIYISY